MLARVPGFTIREAIEERGLGQATGNVLLNGQRISGKSDDVQTRLSRIPASNVRIEIRDGATLAIPGLSGQVANVVRATGITRMPGAPNSAATSPIPCSPASRPRSAAGGAIEYTLGLENQSSHSGAGITIIRDVNGNLLDTRDDAWTGEFEQPRVSGRPCSTGRAARSATSTCPTAVLVRLCRERLPHRTRAGRPQPPGADRGGRP